MQPATATVPPPDHRTDADLVRLARAGDAVAFGALVERGLDRAHRIASALIGVDAAADVVVDAFVAAWRELPRLRDEAAFSVWFDGILVSACSMGARRAGSVVVPVRPPPAAPGPGGLDEGLERARALDLLEAAFEQLDMVDRAVLVLHEVAERLPSEVAPIVHEPIGAVRVRHKEATLSLLRALEDRV